MRPDSLSPRKKTLSLKRFCVDEAARQAGRPVRLEKGELGRAFLAQARRDFVRPSFRRAEQRRPTGDR